MPHIVIFDCEFLTARGAPQRFWCGPMDPDPVIAQIGLVKLALTAEAPILDTRRIYVTPPGRDGGTTPLDPLFVRLTGITQDGLDDAGVSLTEALTEVETFAEGARLWSWGKDEFNMVAISCYVAGLTPPIPVTRFGNACHLLLKGGMPLEDLEKTRSNALAAYYQIVHPPLRGHDALDDALSVAYTLQHLLGTGALSPDDIP